MSQQSIMLRDNAVQIEPYDGSAVVKIDASGGTVYYSDNRQVSATSNQGSIAPGGTATFTGNTWITSVGVTTSVLVTTTSIYDEWAQIELPITAADLNAAGLDTDGKLLGAQARAGLFGTWNTLGDPGVGGEVTALSHSPYDISSLFVGGDMGGVGKSTDGAESWQSTYDLPAWEINSFTHHPANGLTVWVCTLAGPAKSVDAGRHWVMKKAGMPTTDTYASGAASTQAVIYDPADATHLHMWAFLGNKRAFITTNPSYGQVYESFDGGETWTLKSTVVSGGNILSAAVSVDGSTLAVCISATGFYTSSDGGITWTISPMTGLASTGHPAWVEAHPTTAATWYVTTDAVYVSTDNLQSFAVLGNHPVSTADFTRITRIHPNGNTMWSGTLTTHVYKTENASAGASAVWTEITVSTSTVPGLQFPAAGCPVALSIAPQDSNTVIWAGQNDMFITKDGGATIRSASNKALPNGKITGRGFSMWLVPRITPSPFVRDTIFANGYDAANIIKSTDGGLSWSNPSGRPSVFFGGYDTSIGGPSGKVVWTLLGQAGSFSGVGISTDGGSTFAFVSGAGVGLPAQVLAGSGADNAYNAVRPISRDGLTAILTLAGKIYKTTDGNTSWTQINVGNAYTELIVDPTTLSNDGSTTTWYAAGANGLRSCSDGGTTYVAINGAPVHGAANYMAFDVSNPLQKKLYQACWQPSSAQSANQGLWCYDITAQTWTRLFNDFSVRQVAVDPTSNGQRIAITTDDNPSHCANRGTGVWVSKDAGVTWTQYATGLRELRVWSVAFDPFKSGRLYCGGNGAGFFVCQLPPYGTSLDMFDNSLPLEQMVSKTGHFNRPFGWPDVADTLPGPLDSSLGQNYKRLYASQAPYAITKTTQTGSYTLKAGDLGTVVEINSASGVTVTIPAGLATYTTAGDVVAFIRQVGAGQVTVAAGGGVTLTGYPSGALKTAAQNATVVLTQRAQDVWLETGQNST